MWCVHDLVSAWHVQHELGSGASALAVQPEWGVARTHIKPWISYTCCNFSSLACGVQYSMFGANVWCGTPFACCLCTIVGRRNLVTLQCQFSSRSVVYQSAILATHVQSTHQAAVCSHLKQTFLRHAQNSVVLKQVPCVHVAYEHFCVQCTAGCPPPWGSHRSAIKRLSRSQTFNM